MTTSPRPAWTAPRVRELFYDEARDRRWQFEAQLERQPIAQQIEIVVAPHVPNFVSPSLWRNTRLNF
jgi:hypothetical protein